MGAHAAEARDGTRVRDVGQCTRRRVRWAGLALKNLHGAGSIAIGMVLAMPGVPGPGLLVILLGVSLLDFPGKRRLKRWFILRPGVLERINHLRRRHGRPPLLIDEPDSPPRRMNVEIERSAANADVGGGADAADGHASIAERVRAWWSDERRLADAVWRLLCAYVVAIPISIAAAQPLVAVTAAVAVRHRWMSGRPLPRTPLDLPIAAFLLANVLAAAVGLDFWRALFGSRSLLLVVTLHLVVGYARSDRRLLGLGGLYLSAMTFTSLCTLLEAISPWPLPDVLPGSMRESGQLLFAIGLTASLWLHGVAGSRFALPLLFALQSTALVLNMKRGVWLGVFVMLCLAGALRSWRSVVGTVLAVVSIWAFVPSVQQRIANTHGDLYRPGHRHDLWLSAVDVFERFPMGVGAKNGTILRDYPNVDPRHKHAHNNVLQVAVETGVIGLAVFLWWMIRFGRISARTWRRIPEESPVPRALALAVFTSFVGFHVAGTVEYNFGDSHVLEAALVFMGIGLALASRFEPRPLRAASTRAG